MIPGAQRLISAAKDRTEAQGDANMNRKNAVRRLMIGLLGAVLTLAGDLMIGAAKFPDGANMIDAYFAIALAMPAWRPILGGLIGFVGISLEYCGLMTVYPLKRQKMPRGGRFYRLAMYVYLAAGGGAVHLPCGAFMWIYKSVAAAAGQAVGHDIALGYLLYFLRYPRLPRGCVLYSKEGEGT